MDGLTGTPSNAMTLGLSVTLKSLRFRNIQIIVSVVVGDSEGRTNSSPKRGYNNAPILALDGKANCCNQLARTCSLFPLYKGK